MSSYYDYTHVYPKGTEAGTGSFLRICPPSAAQAPPPQVDPKQSTQQVQGGMMNFPQQRQANIYRQNAPRMNTRQATPQVLVPSAYPMVPNAASSTMFIQSHHTYPALIIQAPQSTIHQGARHQSHGGGQGGSGAAPPPYYSAAPNQAPVYPMQTQSLGFTAYNNFVYNTMRTSPYTGQGTGPQPGAPAQHPSQPPQHNMPPYVMDHNVASGGGPGPTGNNPQVIMPQHNVPQQVAQQPTGRRRKNCLTITDPTTGRDILSDILSENISSQSEDSSSSATPLSNPPRDGQVAAEFAEKVAKAVAGDKYNESTQVLPPMMAAATISNGPSTPPPSQPPPPTPPSSAVEINLPPSVLPPMPPAQTHNIIPAQPQQVVVSHSATGLLSQPPIQIAQIGLNQPHSVPHVPLHVPQTPQIPTVSANADTPSIDLPRPKGPASAHSPGRKPTPVPSTITPNMDQKKKEKKVNTNTSVLPTHREEPEEAKKPSFTEAYNIKNVQPVNITSVHQMSTASAQNVSAHINEPETNGEPEVQQVPIALPSHTAPKVQEKNDQPPQERGGKVIQKSKTKRKATLKELNRKGQEKEGGTDMDAFTSVVSPVIPPATSVSATLVETVVTSPAVPHTSTPPSTPVPAEVSVELKPSESQPPLPVAVVQPAQQQQAALVPPATTNKTVDNEKNEGMEGDMDEEEDVVSSIVVAVKNDENSKISGISNNSESEDIIINETPVIEQPTPPILRYTYKEGQWSPINLEGKKAYDRDFLLGMRHDDLSNKRPIIEECDILKTDSTNNNINNSNNNRRPLHGSNSMNISRDGFVPPFMRSSSSQRGGMMNKRGSQQGGRPGGGGGRSKGMYPSSSQYKSDLEEELHWAQKGGSWKPDRCKTPPKLTEEEVKTEKLYKMVRGILNKLTPQKFDTLMDQIMNLPIDNLLRLQGVVELVFDKAVDEPSFSRAYAKLCQNLGKLQIKNNDGSEGGVEATTFRKILLNKCQLMFEKKSNDGKKSDERLAELQQQTTAEQCKEKRKELQLILEEEERKVRVKYVGLARFIGELFKLSMLTTKIMHNCIKTLLEKVEEEPLECLCKLLTTVGKELEEAAEAAPSQKNDIEEYFQKMKKLSTKSAQSKVSSRVRFMLQDVIELRTNKWVPRRDENNPKTMEQIQKDAERETLMESLQANTPRNKHDRDDRRRGPRNNTQDSDGWQLERTSKFRSYAFEPSKLQNLKGIDNEGTGNLSLGSHTQFSQWNSGSNAKRSGGEPKRPEFSNKFAALSMQEEKKMPTMMSRKVTPSSSIEKDRGIQGVREALGDRDNRLNRGLSSNPSSRDNSRIRNKPLSAPQPPPVEQEQIVKKEPTMDPEACKKKARVLLEEWIANRNPKESAESIKETFPDSTQFIQMVMEFIFDEKSHKRIAFGELLEILLSKQVVTASGVSKELSSIMELGEDLMIDLPHVWSYFAEFMVPPMSKGLYTFADLKVACEPLNTPHLSKTLAEIFKCLIKDKGPGFIRSQWESSNVSLKDFIPEGGDVDNFIRTNNLGFLTGDSEIEPSEVIPMSKVEEKLYTFLIQDGDKATDLICDWVKGNVGPKSQDVEFIEALTRAVIKACLNKNNKIIPGSLSKHSMLIKKYVDTNEKRELACLSGINQLIVNELESPQGILLEIFQTLADDGTIAIEGFLKWKASTKHEISKGVALKTLSHFFVSLSEQVDSGEEST